MAYSKLVILIKTVETRGTGKSEENDPARQVDSWWTLDGKFVAERDYWKEEQEKEAKHGKH